MDSLTDAIRRCNLKLKLDNETEGQGNCFPNSIVQQCRRPEVRKWLKEKKPTALFNGQHWVRKKVANFALNSIHNSVTELKTKYESELQSVERKSWKDYWNNMAQNGTWVDHMFVQLTAWYMELDILILTTSSKPDAPFIYISGDIDKTGGQKNGPPILLGNYTNVHYQSLLVDQGGNEQIIDEEPTNTKIHAKESDNEIRNEDFVYIQSGEIVTFKSISNGKFECPGCKKHFASILKHINGGRCKVTKN